jgi:Uma2 family endonuclease
MVVREPTITVEQFWEEYAGKPFELVEGKVVKVPFRGGLHGIVAARIGTILSNFVIENSLGDVFATGTAFQLGDDLRGTDAAFVSMERWQTVTEPDNYIPFAPDLAVEVVSPNDTAADVRAKVDL